MRFNKAKAVRAAEKSLSQGKIPNAIGDYCRIVEHDPHDWTALNMLGDLYVRVGKKDEAANCFTRVGEHYRGQGFALKAIAMYKKILRLRPEDAHVAMLLAGLYAGQGLIVEARAQYLSIADAHTRAGRKHDALDVLRCIADLDPRNPEIRLRVADGYKSENFRDEAAEAYTQAGECFSERGNYEPAVHAFTEAMRLREFDLRILNGLTEAHINLDTADEAADILSQAASKALREKRIDAAEILLLLVRAHLAAGDPANAERAVERLVSLAQNPASGTNYHLVASAVLQYVDVARLYLRVGDTDAGVQALTPALDQMLTERRDAELFEVLNEALARNPEHREALRLLARVQMWQNDADALRPTLERLAEAAALAGARDEERDALLRLINLAPGNTEYRARLQGIDSGGEETVGASHEVPTFENFMLTSDEVDDVEDVASEDAALPHIVQTEDEVAVWTPDPSASFADLNAETGDEAIDHATSEESFTGFEPEMFGAVREVVHQEQESTTSSNRLDDSRFTELLAGEMESVDFYITQGYTDVARDTLDMLERQYGAHRLIDERRSQLQASSQPTENDAQDVVASQTANDAEFNVENAAVEQSLTFADEAIAEVEATPVAQTPETTAALVEVEAETFAAPQVVAEEVTGEWQLSFDESATQETAASEDTFEFQNFDLDSANTATEEAETVESFDFISTPEFSETLATSIETAEAFVEASPSGESNPPCDAQPSAFDAGLAAIFDEFRSAVEEEEPQSTADYDTHYNLGIAYKEMGLLDEAVEEFQKAAAIVAPADGTPRYLQCCNYLGHCFIEKGMPSLAVMWFRKGLNAPGHTEEEYQALRYELAIAHEAGGEVEAAINAFTEVYGTNIAYRDVSEKLRELKSKLVGVQG